MSVFANHKDFGGDFGNEVSRLFEGCMSLDIASGYFGRGLVDSLMPELLRIAARGRCRVLVGMIFNEGVTESQKRFLEALDSGLQSASPESGVFVSMRQFHGKVYLFRGGAEESIFVGSSNFSESGFKYNLEFNVLVDEARTKASVTSFLDYLFGPTCDFVARLGNVELLTRERGRRTFLRESADKSPLQGCLVNDAEFPEARHVESVVEIKLRVDDQPNSSLNLFFEKGRKTQMGKYTPRPWYEVEVTSTAQERKQAGYPIDDFIAYARDGDNKYRIPMITASDKFKAITSRNNRLILGELIKGRLERGGVLVQGERITSETLEDYGNDKIVLRKFAEKEYYLDF